MRPCKKNLTLRRILRLYLQTTNLCIFTSFTVFFFMFHTYYVIFSEILTKKNCAKFKTKVLTAQKINVLNVCKSDVFLFLYKRSNLFETVKCFCCFSASTKTTFGICSCLELLQLKFGKKNSRVVQIAQPPRQL